MKLPRWLVISMLTSSALAVLAAAGWWWVTWPERTAREFISLMAEGKLDCIRVMLRSGDFDPYSIDDAIEVIQEERADLHLTSVPLLMKRKTSWSEVLIGTGHFSFASRVRESGLYFTSTRGKIKFVVGGYAIISTP